MRKLLTAGIFGTILSLTGANYACASIISRGFFDEAMENYATTTALDLKANQSDFNFINMEVDPELWNDQRESEVTWSRTDAAPIIAQLFPNFVESPYIPDSISSTLLSSLIRIDRPGIAGFTNKLLNGWTDKGGTNYPGLFYFSKNDGLLQSAYKSDNSASLFIDGANATNIRGVDYTGPVYPLWKLSEGIDKIGTLPSGNFPIFLGHELLFPELKQPLTYPTSLAELITAIYGNSETKSRGLLAAISEGFQFDSDLDGRPDDYIGLIPNYNLAKNADEKIGTLPTETAMSSCSVWRAIDLTQNKMPETIGGILEQLYSAGHMDGSCDHDGYNGPSLPNIIRRLIYGYNYNGGTEMLGINGLNVGLTDSTGNVIEPGLRQITNGWTDAKGGVIINPGLKGMYDGWTDSAGETYQGIKALNEGWTDKNGSNPGIKGMFDGWTDKGGTYFPGLYSYSKGETLLESAYNSDNTYSGFSRLLINGANSTTIRGVDYTGPVYPLWKLSQGIGTLPSGKFPDFPEYNSLFSWLNQKTIYPTSLAELITALYGNSETGYLGLLGAIIAGFQSYDQDGRPADYMGLIPNYQLAKTANDKIGTLPDGITLQRLYELWNEQIIDSLDMLKSLWGLSTEAGDILAGTDPKKFPNDIRGAFNATSSIFGSILNGLSNGWLDKSTNTYYGGIIDLNNGWLDKSTNTTYQGVKGLNDVIGTLPTEIPNNDSSWTRYGFVETPGTPIDLPDTIGGMFAMLFNEDGTYNGLSLRNIMTKILMGFDTSGGRIEGLSPLTSVYNLTGDSPIVTAVKANTAAIEKIGTVPAGYDNVGAALTAMKSDIDAKNLPSTSDDGQYVLTAKKVGETITYTWVKMDLTTEEQGQ